MSSLDQLKKTFFDECGELLQQIETGLTEIREGSGTDDTINAVFRAVHSVKGGAGIFGFETLVGFAHVFETVLDAHAQRQAWRRRRTIVDVLLPAGDVLTDLVDDVARGRGDRRPTTAANAARRSKQLMRQDGGATAATTARRRPISTASISCRSRSIDDDERPTDDAGRRYRHRVPARSRTC